MPIDTASYTARISSASQTQLCVITYEILLERIDQALMCGEDDTHGYKAAVEKARYTLQTLLSALDMDNEIARQLFSLYVFADKLLVQAYFSGDRSSLQDARMIFEPLMLAYREAEAADVPENVKQAVLNPSQHIYAGLTYTGGKLDEYVDQDTSRGFRA
ncbi:MAG: flagellar protein FliS [Defluviitaleaceae bacterium]|nr:flagellar protein FliS [Defluviitaleaceae bacterium]